MSWRWLKPGEAPPGMDIGNFNFSRFEEQRRAAAQAALQMSARSDFLYNDIYGDGDSGDELDSSEEFERECEAGIPKKLRYAVWAFNIKCEEDGESFQWFDENIEGPMNVQVVKADHRKPCELCNSLPSYGEVYFTYNWAGPWDHSKLCQTCGTGVLHAAMIAAGEYKDDDEDEGEEGEEEEGAPAAAGKAAVRGRQRPPTPPPPAAVQWPPALVAAEAADAAAAAEALARRTGQPLTEILSVLAAAAAPPPSPAAAARGTDRRQAAADPAAAAADNRTTRSTKRAKPTAGGAKLKPQPKKRKS